MQPESEAESLKDTKKEWFSCLESTSWYAPFAILTLLSAGYATGIPTKYPIIGAFCYLVAHNLSCFNLSFALKDEIGLKFDEFIVSNFLLGTLVTTLLYTYLNQVFALVQPVHLMLALTTVSGVSSLAFSKSHMSLFQPRKFVNTLNNLRLMGIILSFITGFVVVSKGLPLQYWRGEDAWGLASVSREITRQSLSITEVFNYFTGYFPLYTPGFYYFYASVMVLTGLPVEPLVRFGGLIMAGITTTLTYLLVKRFSNPFCGLISSFMLFLSPYMVSRFISPLREYYGFLFVIILILVVDVRERSKDDAFTAYTIVVGFLVAASIVTHTLSPIFVAGIIVPRLFKQLLEGRRRSASEFIFASLFGLVASSVYLPYAALPFIEFLSLNIRSFMVFSVFSVVVIIFVLIYLVPRIGNRSITVSNSVKLAALSAMLAVAVVNIYFPPRFGPSYEYTYIAVSHFPKTLIPIGVFGYLLVPFLGASFSFYSLIFLISGSLGVSYLGFSVPLNRFSVYITWVMSVVAGLGLFRVAPILDVFNVKLEEYNCRNALVAVKKHLENNKTSLLLVLLLVLSGISEYRLLPRQPITFGEVDVSSVTKFASGLAEGDLVVHSGTLNHLLYYVNISPSNLVSIENPWNWFKEFYAASDIYELTECVSSTFPGVDRFHFVVLNDLFIWGERDIPDKKLLEYYGAEEMIGTLRVFTFNLPFAIDDVPLQKTRFVGRGTTEPVIPNGSKGSWDYQIQYPSNVILQRHGDSAVFTIFYTGVDDEGVRYIGAARSTDGVNWVKYPEPFTSEGYEDPYIALVNESVYIYARKVSDGSIVCLSDNDGEWSQTAVSVSRPGDLDYWVAESPLIWFYEEQWHLLYTETKIEQGFSSTRLVHLESLNGLNWTQAENPEWDLFDTSYRRYGYTKLLLTDVCVVDDGLLFFGELDAEKEYGQRLWRAATVHVENLGNRNAVVCSLNFKDYYSESDRMDSVQLLVNPFDGRKYYYYIDYGDGGHQGVTQGISMGYVSDHSGIPNNYIITP